MAGHKVGTIFVELDLDPSRYTKGQQRLLQDATSTTLNIEKNFQNLGIKSAAHFDLLRAKAANSFERIVNTSKVSAADIIRAEEAKNAKLKALNEEQYGAHKSFIDNLKSSWVAASAAIVAAWMLVGRAVSYMDQGAKALQVESSFKIMAESAGVAADDMIANMRRATRETIDDSDLMQKAVKLMTLGYDSEKIERFSKVVITASQIAGTTVAEAYDNLADAIANRMPKALVRMGAVTREQMKVVTKAIEAGASTTSLYELAMANLEAKQKMLQGTQDQATISMQRFHAHQKETAESIGKGLIVVLDATYRAFQFLAGGVLGVVSAYARYRSLVYSAMGDEKKAAENIEIANAAWAARKDLVDKAGKAIFLEGDVGKKATAEEIQQAKDKAAAQMAALKSIADRAKGAKEILKAELDGYKKTYEMEVEMVDHASKMRVIAGENELNFIVAATDQKLGSLAREFDAQEKAVKKSILLAEVKKAKIQELDSDYLKQVQKLEDDRKEQAYKAIEFQKVARSSYYAWDRKQELDVVEYNRTLGGRRQKISAETWDQIAEYQRLTGEKLEQWQHGHVDAMLIEYKETYLGGMKVALHDYADESANVGKQMQDATLKAFKSMEDALVTFCQTGKFNFADFANAVIADLIRIQIRASITGPLSAGMSGVLSSLFGGGPSAASAQGLGAAQIASYGELAAGFHSGGMSYEGTPRMVSPFVFAGAPRYHSGIGPGERAAVLREDEGVFTPGQMKALGSRGDSVTVININAVDAKSFEELCRRNPGAIIQPVTQGLRDNKTRREWKGLLS